MQLFKLAKNYIPEKFTYCLKYNPGQNISYRVKKSNKIKPGAKDFDNCLCIILAAIT